MSGAVATSIDAGLVAALIREQAPHWTTLPVRAVADGGWSNRTFRLGHDLVVRLPSAERYVAQVEKERRWLPRLAPLLPLPIPAPLFAGRPGHGYPWPWGVYGWIAGAPPSDAATRTDVALARDLAAFLRALHGLAPANGPPAGVHNFHRGGDLRVYDEEARAAFAALTAPQAAVANLVWKEALASSWSGPPAWLHGDVSSGNLILRDGHLAAVIDFGNMAVGDPACDLVAAWTLFDGGARETFAAALPHDTHTWSRAQGWALWKAAITVAGHDPNRKNRAVAERVLAELLSGA